MAEFWDKAKSILGGNSNSGLRYLITTVSDERNIRIIFHCELPHIETGFGSNFRVWLYMESKWTYFCVEKGTTLYYLAPNSNFFRDSRLNNYSCLVLFQTFNFNWLFLCQTPMWTTHFVVYSTPVWIILGFNF